MKNLLLIASLFGLSGCAWNPFQPSPGGTEFRMTADGKFDYSSTGRDVKRAKGKITFPNGASGEFEVTGSTGSGSSDVAVNAQAQLNALLIALLGSKIPNIATIMAAGAVP